MDGETGMEVKGAVFRVGVGGGFLLFLTCGKRECERACGVSCVILRESEMRLNGLDGALEVKVRLEEVAW